MTDNTIVFHEPVRPGDVLAHAPDPALGERAEDDEARHRPLLGDRRRVPQPARRARRRRVVHRLRLPAGTAHERQADARRRARGRRAARARATTSPRPPSCSARSRAATGGPMHHDHDFAVNRNGTRDIFLNTPNQAAWFERYLTDWSGPKGRLGRMKFRMKGRCSRATRWCSRARSTRSRPTTRAAAGSTVLVTLTVDGDLQDRLHGAHRAARPATTTTRGPAAATTGRPVSSEEYERWIWTSPPSRRCCGRWCAGCAARTRRSTRCARSRTIRSAIPTELWKQMAELDLIGLMVPSRVRRLRA